MLSAGKSKISVVQHKILEKNKNTSKHSSNVNWSNVNWYNEKVKNTPNIQAMSIGTMKKSKIHLNAYIEVQ